MTERHEVGEAALLADPTDVRSNCGVGVVMDLDGGESHEILDDGMELVECMEHRGTTGAEQNTGDGAGILIQIPHEFFADEVPADLPDPGEYAVGSLFLPQDEQARAELKALVEEELAAEGLDVLAWRAVPTNNGDLGQTALDSEPAIQQVFVEPAEEMSEEAFERALYIGRRVVENTVERQEPAGHERFYIVSLDRKTVVYKGLLKADQVREYFPELGDQRMQSTFAMVHARFSTNTLGAWHLAHPYRNIIHNGEFNTIQGNINWMR
ncbi:MAG: glutamate synthase subunit alpha, partial [Halovenus sp.]